MCMIVVNSCSNLLTFVFLSKFLIAEMLISECSDFDWSWCQNCMILNCYQHFLFFAIVFNIFFLTVGVIVGSFWLLSEYVYSFCYLSCFPPCRHISLIGVGMFYLLSEFSDCWSCCQSFLIVVRNFCGVCLTEHLDS